MKRISLFLLCAVTFGGVVCWPQRAVAFWYLECAGEAVRWDTDEVVIDRLPVSFPTGATVTNALTRTESRWNSVTLADFSFVDSPDSDDDEEFGNDVNEIGVFAYDDLPVAAAGITMLDFTECEETPGPNMEIIEADIFFPPYIISGLYGDLPWSFGTPDPRRGHDGSAIFFRAALLHELGHALGLHLTVHEDSSLDTMNSFYPTGGWYPGARKNRIRPHGDVRAGIQFLYPGQGTPKTDIAVINFVKRSDASTGNAELIAPPQTLWGSPFCPNDNTLVEFNFGNPGDVAVTFDLAFYLSFDTSYDDADILLDVDTWYSGLGLGSYEPKEVKTLAIPEAAFGSSERTAYILFFADYENEIAEVRESNNVVAVPGEITLRRRADCP